MYSLESVDALTADALSRAFSQRNDRPESVIALVPDAERDKIALIQKFFGEQRIGIAGAVFPQIVVDTQLRTKGAVFLGFRGDARPLLIENAVDAAGVARVAEQVRAHVESTLAENERGTLLAFFDGLVPNVASHLAAWYLRLGNRVRYAGANAGNDRFEPAPCLFDATKFVGDGLLVTALPDHPGAFLSHGYRPPAKMIAATSTAGNKITTLDWRPALEVYAELVKESFGLAVNRENFYQLAVNFPFGILRADGEVLVRIPVALADDGSIVCIGEIEANAVLVLLDSRDGGAPESIAEDLAKSGITGDLLTFYCAGRSIQKGEGVGAELERLHALSGGRLRGALSLGEICGARAGGYPLFHNAAMVGIPCQNR